MAAGQTAAKGCARFLCQRVNSDARAPRLRSSWLSCLPMEPGPAWIAIVFPDLGYAVTEIKRQGSTEESRGSEEMI